MTHVSSLPSLACDQVRLYPRDCVSFSFAIKTVLHFFPVTDEHPGEFMVTIVWRQYTGHLTTVFKCQTFQMLYSSLYQQVVMKIALKCCVQCNVFEQNWSSWAHMDVTYLQNYQGRLWNDEFLFSICTSSRRKPGTLSSTYLPLLPGGQDKIHSSVINRNISVIYNHYRQVSPKHEITSL